MLGIHRKLTLIGIGHLHMTDDWKKGFDAHKIAKRLCNLAVQTRSPHLADLSSGMIDGIMEDLSRRGYLKKIAHEFDSYEWHVCLTVKGADLLELILEDPDLNLTCEDVRTLHFLDEHDPDLAGSTVPDLFGNPNTYTAEEVEKAFLSPVLTLDQIDRLLILLVLRLNALSVSNRARLDTDFSQVPEIVSEYETALDDFIPQVGERYLVGGPTTRIIQVPDGVSYSKNSSIPETYRKRRDERIKEDDQG